MQIVISGRPGSGKTTLIKEIIKSLKLKWWGFYTEEVRVLDKRVGFRMVLSNGETVDFASIYIKSPQKVGRYGVLVESLEEVIRKIEVADTENDLLIIDELGKMEFKSKKFVDFVEKNILNGERSFIVTIPFFDFHPIVRDVRKNFTVFNLTLMSKNKAFFEILKLIDGRKL